MMDHVDARRQQFHKNEQIKPGVLLRVIIGREMDQLQLSRSRIDSSLENVGSLA
jgi:hypothetical protein